MLCQVKKSSSILDWGEDSGEFIKKVQVQDTYQEQSQNLSKISL